MGARELGIRQANVGRDRLFRLERGELAALEPEQPVTADVGLTNAKLTRAHVEALPWKRNWRLTIDFEPEGKKPVDLRAVMQLRGQNLTETWTSTFRP